MANTLSHQRMIKFHSNFNNIQNKNVCVIIISFSSHSLSFLILSLYLASSISHIENNGSCWSQCAWAKAWALNCTPTPEGKKYHTFSFFYILSFALTLCYTLSLSHTLLRSLEFQNKKIKSGATSSTAKILTLNLGLIIFGLQKKCPSIWISIK